jgi:hypothetical protein
MKLEHAIDLVRKGSLRIGTLNDFKKSEKHSGSILDKDEGISVTYSEDEMDLSRPDTVPSFLRKHVRADEVKYWKISNLRFQVTYNSPDYYIFTVSEEYSPNITRSFGYDSCVQIDQPEMFFGILTDCLYKKGKIKDGGSLLQDVFMKIDHSTTRKLEGHIRLFSKTQAIHFRRKLGLSGRHQKL